MANNSNRKAIEFMVQGALPPHSTNVLWMDTSVPTLPVLKIFENGAWTTVHTEQGKVDELLAKTVLEQAKVIDTLTNGINTKLDTVTEDLGKAVDSLDTVTEDLGKAVDSLDTVTEDLDTLQQTVAKEENATANKNEVKQEIRNVAGDCTIFKYLETGLPMNKEDGFCCYSDDGDYIIEDIDVSAEHSQEYKVGDVIKPTTLGESGYDLIVAKSVSERLYYDESFSTIYGITEIINWLPNHYYHVTGIHNVYDEQQEEILFHIFTYEEVSNETITDLGKQLSDKIDSQVAKESTSLEIKELVLREGIILADEYAQTINDIVGDFSNE